MSAQYPQQPAPQQMPYQQYPERPRRQKAQQGGFNLFGVGPGSSWDLKNSGGLGSLLNFGLLGLINGKSPLLNPGIALQGLMGGAFDSQQYPHHPYGYGAPQYQRPQAPVPQTGTPPIIPQQPGAY